MSTQTATPTRWTTCKCADDQHASEALGHSIFRAESDAAMVARIIGGRHVVPVSEMAVDA